MLGVSYHVGRSEAAEGQCHQSCRMLLKPRIEPTPRGSSYGGHLKSCKHRQVTKGRVAAALATSVKWGKRLVRPLGADQSGRQGVLASV